mmetsp:Transcript_27266/g.41780  ORF Transcript_27266/g.41780 Transcript_27266/m.41780 type:complete len:1025 (+) Transcript_27266:71-3145(+)
MSKIYNRTCGIRASPLHNEILQPPGPPASATRKQLALFARVLDRRSHQLRLLSQESLETVYDLLQDQGSSGASAGASAGAGASTGKASGAASGKSNGNSNGSGNDNTNDRPAPTAQELIDLFTHPEHGLPHKQPRFKREYISIVHYLLIKNFHASIDTSLSGANRQEALKKVRHIFQCLDLAYYDYTETQKLKAAEKKKKKEKKKGSTADGGDSQSSASGGNHKDGTSASGQASASASASALASASESVGQKQKQVVESAGSGTTVAGTTVTGTTDTGTTETQHQLEQAIGRGRVAAAEESASTSAKDKDKDKSGETTAGVRATAGSTSSSASAPQGGNNNSNTTTMGSLVSKGTEAIANAASGSTEVTRKSAGTIVIDLDDSDEDDDGKDDHNNDTNKNKNMASSVAGTSNGITNTTAGIKEKHENLEARGDNTTNNNGKGTTNAKEAAADAKERLPNLLIRPTEEVLPAIQNKLSVTERKFIIQALPRSPRKRLSGNNPKRNQYHSNVTINFLADDKHTAGRCQNSMNMGIMGLLSNSLHPRGMMQAHFYTAIGQWNGHEASPTTKSLGLIEGPILDNVHSRFAKWDPYWNVVKDVSIIPLHADFNAQRHMNPPGYVYEAGYTTSIIQKLNRTSSYRDEGSEMPVSTCRLLTRLDMNANGDNYQHFWKGMSFGKLPSSGVHGQFQNGERRLMLRALPLTIPEKYKKSRADTHLWPKGTFVQYKNVPTNPLGRDAGGAGTLPVPIVQRKQQSHDRNLWKGMCHMLDLTPHVTNGRNPMDISICTKDSDEYAFQLAICDYVSPDALMLQLMNNNDKIHNGGGVGSTGITKLTPEEGLALLQKNLDDKDTVVLDDSDGEDDDNDGKDKDTTTNSDADSVYLTCSLVCSVSLRPIQIPVRGKNCKHMQCFDLSNYLATNSVINGNRWRCMVCEDFLPVQDLMVDGFISKILDKHRHEVSSARDKVEIYRDGSWKLLNENRLRYGSKKRPSVSSSDLAGDSKRAKTNGGNSKNAAPAVVIDILDDDE